jgi:hypothetical protein
MMLTEMFEQVKPTMNWLKDTLSTTIGLYSVWIIGHYIAVQLYVHHCANLSITGFMLSPIVCATPYCKGLVWVINNGSYMITNMWILVGTWISVNIFKTIQKNT